MFYLSIVASFSSEFNRNAIHLIMFLIYEGFIIFHPQFMQW